MKKLFCIILAIMMLLSMSACGEDAAEETKDPKATDAAPEGTTAPAGSAPTTEPVDNRPVVTIGMPIGKNVISMEKNALTLWIEENFDVKLEFTLYAGAGEIGQQVTTMVNTGHKLPDILFGIGLDADGLAKFIKDGYFWELTPYFDNKDGATLNFWTRITERLTEEQQNSVLEAITDAGSGKIYGVPTIETTGNATEVTMTCKLDTFISKDCADPDLAFEILMSLWTWEGSMRVRYGEFGANWVAADPGAKSPTGLDATFKLLSDPLTQLNTAHWGIVACCFNEYANGETAQIPA